VEAEIPSREAAEAEGVAGAEVSETAAQGA